MENSNRTILVTGAGGNALVLRAILGQEPRTLRQYIEELARKASA
ncbi:hypothetical protein [Nostoc sp. PA-18-2419]|nr:hypothetical protein [Nostoc sp. PA-18-2419]